MTAAHLHGKELLSEARIARLRARSNVVGALLVAHAWAVIVGAMAVFAWWPNLLTWLVAVIVIGGRQLGLAILMHDASHRALFAHPRVNDWVGRHLCGAPVGADMRLYRPYHLEHHRHTQTAQDPDLELSAPFPISRASLWRKVRRDLLGVTGYQRRRAQFQRAMGNASWPVRVRRLWRAEWPFFVSNAVLWLALALAGHGWLYVLLWLVPLLTWYQLASRVRNIAEHAVVGAAEDPLRNTRTTQANWLERVLWAPYWVNYHLEHHLFIYAPCWNLPMAHRWLGEQGLWPRMELAPGYRSVLRAATSRADDDRGSASGRKSVTVQGL